LFQPSQHAIKKNSTKAKHKTFNGLNHKLLVQLLTTAGFGDMLHCEKSFNALEYRRILQKGLLLKSEKLLSQEE